MKTTAHILNVLLIMITTLILLSDGFIAGGTPNGIPPAGGPRGPMWLLALLAIAAPTVNILALRGWQVGKADRTRTQKTELSEKQRRLEEKKPLYEWIETVERRLAAIEASASRSSRGKEERTEPL